VLIERGAGAGAQFTDQAYEHAGATLAERNTVWSDSDVLLKVRVPSVDGSTNEVDVMRKGGTLLSFIYPAQNPRIINALAARGVTSFAMDMIPRISRAQVFDALRFVALSVQFQRRRLTFFTAQWQTSQGIKPSWRLPITLVVSCRVRSQQLGE
jgi:NAD/NADP transhydrogenase alpha subunit